MVVARTSTVSAEAARPTSLAPVQVIGVDSYDLDGDSDGIGCE